nr:GntR family transcriptional regulator [Mesorhizobium amorphae]
MSAGAMPGRGEQHTKNARIGATDMEMTKDRRPKGTGTRWAYEEIRSQILALQLKPGADLDEQVLIGILGVSRTPIREALIQLAAEGLVEMLPNRGARVSRVDLSGVREFFEALDAAQRMVTRWAALRRTQQDIAAIDAERRRFEKTAAEGDIAGMMDTNLAFHEAIGVASGNALVAKHYAQLLALGLRLSRISLAYEGTETRRDQHIETIIEEHRIITGHIVSGDANAADEIARAHTELFRKRVLGYMTNSLAADMSF